MICPDPLLNDVPSEAQLFDLAIVGGGVVGLTLAAALRDRGLAIAIVESRPKNVVADRLRAYHFSLLSSRILAGIGVWPQIESQVAKFQGIRLSDGDENSVVEFSPRETESEHLGYGAEHRVLVTELQQFLEDHVQWFCPNKVTAITNQSAWSELALTQGAETHIIRAKLVVGADGPKSEVRQFAGIEARGWKYWQSCVTARIHHPEVENHAAFERFWPTGPMGVLPLDPHHSQIVWTAPHADAKAWQLLPESEFIDKLEAYTSGLLGSLSLISPRQVFPVQLLQCDRYVQPRLALVGDAAHCCHPVGGQGLNQGIRDAAALAEIIEAAVERDQDPGSLAVLKRYERWRKPENYIVLGLTDLLDRSFSNAFWPLQWSRRVALGIMKRLSPLKVFSIRLMTGLLLRLPSLAQR
ncbi:MAG: FAD-dependent hydroxylase [Cyanobacteria bacterium P01_H01_bin.15]